MFCDFECQSKFNGSVHTICSAYLCDSYGHAHLINKRAKPFFSLFASSFHHSLQFAVFVGEIIASFECFVFETSQECRYWSDFSLVYEYGYRSDIWFCVRVHASVVFSLCLINTFFSHFFNERRKKKLEKALNSLNS